MKNNALVRIVVGGTMVAASLSVGIGHSVGHDESIDFVPAQTVERPVPVHETPGWESWMEGLSMSEIAEELMTSKVDNGSTRVEVYEDGSGVQLVNGMPVRSFASDTFVWDCANMGNRQCGPTLPVTE